MDIAKINNKWEPSKRSKVQSKRSLLWKDLKRTRYLQLMLIFPIAWYIIFHYLPMYGVVIAFKDFKMRDGILASPSVGFDNFRRFIQHPYFWRVIRNTFRISLYTLIFTFPIPIIFALILNEVRRPKFKKLVQTVSYLPHFISSVAVVGMMIMMLSPTSGAINKMLESYFGIEPIYFMQESKWFIPMYLISGIWQSTGWNAIIYLAALSGIDMQLYEAATIDGAGRFRQIWHITLPGIKPTIVILLILNIGSMLTVGSEKILLMYTPLTYEVADVISTFVYRVGLGDADYSFSTAIGLMNSIVNMVLLTTANRLSRKYADFSLW